MISRDDAIKIIQKLPSELIPTGSFVRNHKVLNDLDFLSLTPLNKILSQIKGATIISKGNKRTKIILNGANIDIWFIDDKNLLPFFQLEFDSGLNIIRLKMKAKAKGLLLSVNGLFKDNKRIGLNIKTKKDIINFIEHF